MEDLPEIERAIEIDADVEEVWDRITNGELAEEWMGVRVDPRRGGKVTVPGRDTIGTVEEVRPRETISWSWREIDGDPSQVTIEIVPGEHGTIVRVTERLLEYRITGTPPTFAGCAA